MIHPMLWSSGAVQPLLTERSGHLLKLARIPTPSRIECDIHRVGGLLNALDLIEAKPSFKTSSLMMASFACIGSLSATFSETLNFIEPLLAEQMFNLTNLLTCFPELLVQRLIESGPVLERDV